MTKEETIQVLKSIEGRAADFPNMTECDWVAIAAAKRHLEKSLEVKEVENFIWNNSRTTVPEDSTNQIICIKEDGLAVSTIGKIVNGTVKWAYLDDLLNTNSFNVEVKEVDLEKEVEDWVKTGPHTSYPWCTIPDAIRITAEHFFELGLKAQKEE
jgi:hypothetical protein